MTSKSTTFFSSALPILSQLHCHVCFGIGFSSSTINPDWILVGHFQIFGGKLLSLKCWVFQSMDMVYLRIRTFYCVFIYLILTIVRILLLLCHISYSAAIPDYEPTEFMEFIINISYLTWIFRLIELWLDCVHFPAKQTLGKFLKKANCVSGYSCIDFSGSLHVLLFPYMQTRNLHY